MSKSVLDIVIKLSKQGGADKETVTGLVQVKKAMMDAVAVAGSLVAAGYAIKKGFDATVGTMVAYADQVRSIAQVSGLSAEESSKLIQITDDLKVSQEDLLKVMQKNGDEYDYSVAGLAAMSDQYLALGSSQEKAAFMQERFGKSWGNFVELMEQGSDRIAQAGDDINKALILDQNVLNSAREYQKQVDELSDSWLAFKIAAGDVALPKTVSMIEKINNEIKEENGRLLQSEKGWRMLLGPIGAVWNAIDLYTDANENSIESTQTVMTGRMQAAQGYLKEASAVREVDAARLSGLASLYATADANQLIVQTMEEMNTANTEFLSTLGQVQSAEEKYQEQAKSLTEERIALEQQKNLLLSQGYAEQSTEIQEINAKLAENSQAAQANAAEHELANRKIILGLLERKLTQDGILDDTELNWLLEKGVAWGVYSQQVVDEARKAIDEANAVADAINGIPSNKSVSINVNTNYATAGADQIKSTSKQGRAMGGAVSAGRMYEVNELGMPELLTFGGKQMLMMPESGGGYVTPLGGGAGGAVNTMGNINVVVNFHSVVTTADREKAQSELSPIIVRAIRDAQLNGIMK